ncbi:hypothetical protein [Actinomadura flavalba]|uniref:hypothetical protein n=1 Tax=Actinomadura flavalba TaxID=1120938 RepID=UPI00037D70EC|nr:hypothetical protein [Actinomadura flavalba]
MTAAIEGRHEGERRSRLTSELQIVAHGRHRRRWSISPRQRLLLRRLAAGALLAAWGAGIIGLGVAAVLCAAHMAAAASWAMWDTAAVSAVATVLSASVAAWWTIRALDELALRRPR